MLSSILSLSYMNIELTTSCPLNCPQCYCLRSRGKNIDLQTALYWLKEAAKHGVSYVGLSGGETLCYPHIYDIIAAAREHCENANIAISGFGFTQNVYEKLVEAGVSSISVSLNGSTKAINSLTRDGYDLAISALELLQKNNFGETCINWVMHSNNADDFPEIISLAEKYDAKYIDIIGLKPDSKKALLTMPSRLQMENVRDIIRSYKGNLTLSVESCYSPMLALIKDTKLFGNFNVGKWKGCIAGQGGFNVNVDGKLSPCRHLDYFEEFSNLEDYWNDSPVMRRLRVVDSDKREPCNTCGYSNFCRHCVAINTKLNGEIYIGYAACPLQPDCLTYL